MSNLLQLLSTATGLSIADILRVGSNAPFRYKVYPIEKRSGGFRLIAQPARELKHIQRSLISTLLEKLPVHNCATAYQIGKSIINNATPHLDSQYLLKLDFTDFFGSIRETDFLRLCIPRLAQLTNSEIELLQSLLFWKDKRRDGLRLSIGAPSSPLLSNTIMYDFDLAVSDFCNLRQINYTRYADDLTFSCNTRKKLDEVLEYIVDTTHSMKNPKLRLNEDKTTFVSRNFGHRVTGLVLSDQGKVSIGHLKKRLLRAQLHRFKFGKLSIEDTESLRGYLAFVQSVEPDFLVSMKMKYGGETLAALMGRPQLRDALFSKK